MSNLIWYTSIAYGSFSLLVGLSFALLADQKGYDRLKEKMLERHPDAHFVSDRTLEDAARLGTGLHFMVLWPVYLLKGELRLSIGLTDEAKAKIKAFFGRNGGEE